MRGLEPPRPKALDPKSSVYTNFTTSAKRKKMVRPSGLEPETYGLEGRCSIQLSYGRKEKKRKKMVRSIGLEPITF